MELRKIRFIEPGNRPYRRSIRNLYTYERFIRNPSIGLLTLATIVKGIIPDTYMYSESISKVMWDDVLDADIVFIGVFTFNANRGYELARYVKGHSDAIVVMGGLHASLNYPEAVGYCDYVLLGEGDESILEFIEAVKADARPSFPGIAYLKEGMPGSPSADAKLSALGDANLGEAKPGPAIIHTGERTPPREFGTIPDRDLLYRYRKMAGHNTLWPQVHASRGCPHNCDYCAVIRHLGREVRTRDPENVIEDIRQSISFHENRLMPRVARVCWITDDNFFADRTWALEVVQAIIESGIDYRFTVQARYEVGLDDEMLDLLKQAGFIELAMGIEFIEDENFEVYHKQSTTEEIKCAIRNTQAHGLNVRGLFILGAKYHTRGVGKRLAAFVQETGISGVLLQSMYFIPGTPIYNENKGRLLHEDWSKCTGHVVHRPETMSPADLQREIIEASATIYSGENLRNKLAHGSFIEKVLAIGEHFWHKSIRRDLEEELPELERYGAPQSFETR